MTPEQKLVALEAGNEKRYALARLRPGLHTGEVRLSDLLRDPPECVTHLLIPELLMMAKGIGRVKVKRIGRLAVNDGVNLCCTVEDATPGALVWLVGWLEGFEAKEWRAKEGRRLVAA